MKTYIFTPAFIFSQELYNDSIAFLYREVFSSHKNQLDQLKTKLESVSQQEQELSLAFKETTDAHNDLIKQAISLQEIHCILSIVNDPQLNYIQFSYFYKVFSDILRKYIDAYYNSITSKDYCVQRRFLELCLLKVLWQCYFYKIIEVPELLYSTDRILDNSSIFYYQIIAVKAGIFFNQKKHEDAIKLYSLIPEEYSDDPYIKIIGLDIFSEKTSEKI